MPECQKDLAAQGKPYPRTCAVCGLGPCSVHPPKLDVTLAPLAYPVVWTAPEGVSIDIQLYLTSDKTHLNTRITIEGALQLAAGEHVSEEAQKVFQEPNLAKLADDWRLMTRAEIAAYQKEIHATQRTEQAALAKMREDARGVPS